MTPLPCVWTGSAFEPTRGFRPRAAEQFSAGEVVALVPYEGRSKKSHDHFFATVTEAWGTLHERNAAQFPTPDSLRHYALCSAGFCDVETFVASSKAEALRLVAFLQAGARPGVQVVVSGASITRLTPHSQSQKAMGKERFQESKDAVLGVIADLIGVKPDELARAA